MSSMVQLTKKQALLRAGHVGKQPYHAGNPNPGGRRKHAHNKDDRAVMVKIATAYGVPYDSAKYKMPVSGMGNTKNKKENTVTLTYRVGLTKEPLDYMGVPIPNPFHYAKETKHGTIKFNVKGVPQEEWQRVLDGLEKVDLTSAGSRFSTFVLVTTSTFMDFFKSRLVDPSQSFKEASPYQRGLEVPAIQEFDHFYGVDPFDDCVYSLAELARRYRELLPASDGTFQNPHWMEVFASYENDLYSIPNDIMSPYLVFANDRFKGQHPDQISEEPVQMEFFSHLQMVCILQTVLSQLADNCCDATNAAWKAHDETEMRTGGVWYHNGTGRDIEFHERGHHVMNGDEQKFNIFIFKSEDDWHGFKLFIHFVTALQDKHEEFALDFEKECDYLNKKGRNTDLAIRRFYTKALLSAMMQPEGDKFRGGEMYAVYHALCNGDFPPPDVFDQQIYEDLYQKALAAAADKAEAEAAAADKAKAEAEAADKAKAEAEAADKAKAEAEAAAAEAKAEAEAASARVAELEKQLRAQRKRSRAEKRQQDEAEVRAKKLQREEAKARAEAKEFAAQARAVAHIQSRGR